MMRCAYMPKTKKKHPLNKFNYFLMLFYTISFGKANIMLQYKQLE